MIRLHGVLLAGLVVGILAPAPAPPDRDEIHRPRYHFTPDRNWMNDPNGLVFLDGEYHLFFQHNPFGDRWGHMSWGHAVSPDLVRWAELPVALAEEEGVMIFSGSAVVDWKNTTGFGRDGRPPLVAIYTGHYPGKDRQNQHIAYSTDRGRTWTKFAGNPVLEIGAKDFRDPKVFWHDPSGQWVMAVAMPTDRRIRFYASGDLKRWQRLGEFGPAGAVKGIWECPDLFPLRVEGGSETKWVLIVSLGDAAVAGGSGMQYFVGSFDGRTFTADPRPASAPPDWVDYGPDFYAAVSWSDVPPSDGRRPWIGWMSNWRYAQDVPTAPWRSAMSVPRALSLREVNGRLRLVQTPVRELERLRGEPRRVELEGVTGTASLAGLADAAGAAYEIAMTLAPSPDAVVALRLFDDGTSRTTLRIDVAKGTLALGRRQSGRVDFHPAFAGDFEAPVRLVDGSLALRVFVDASSVEAFVNDGETVVTGLVFPPPGARGLSLDVERGSLRSVRVNAWPLESAFRTP